MRCPNYTRTRNHHPWLFRLFSTADAKTIAVSRRRFICFWRRMPGRWERRDGRGGGGGVVDLEWAKSTFFSFSFSFLNSRYRGYVLSADCGGQGPAWRVSKEEGDEDDGSRGRFLAPLALPPSKHPPLWMRECCWIAKTDLASSVEKNFAIHLCLALQRFPSFLLNKRPSFSYNSSILRRDDVIKWKGIN